ncbi:MobF family relaxase [Nocardioides sp.]|uniref:MobF family relaxase n=1 Tax=Nocardioides sp. TaxID=35761 RepID=UPI003D0F0F8C
MLILLRITAIGAGAVDYLLRGSGCCPEHERAQDLDAAQEQQMSQGREHGHGHGERAKGGAARYFGSAVEHGEPAGRWGGKGLDLFGIEAGAEASEGDVRAVFGKLQDPRTGESLGRAPRKFKNTADRVAVAVEAEPDATPERRRELELAAAADGRKAVAYYDLTFSPAKSVSVYYAALLAAGQTEAAAAVAAAHDRAVETAMAYAEEHVAYTRTGYHGRTRDGRSVGRYEAGEGLIWTKWRHSTNRESEPQLHTHVALLNRLKTLSDGVIRALDGRGLRPVKEAIATAYERALEEELVAVRGVVFADRGDGKAREIVGVDPELCQEASTRRKQTLEKAEELTAQYVARNGREPDAAARKAILHDAAMATRRPKEGVQGPAAVAAWGESRAERLVATLEAVADAAEAAAVAGHPDTVAGLRLDPSVPEQRAALLAAAVDDVQREYATWTLGNLVAAIDRRLVAVPGDAAGQARPRYLEALAREAVAAGNAHGVLQLTAPDPVAVPEELRRQGDGRSVFRPHIDERYATAGQLAAEERIVAGARQLTAPAIAGPELELLRVELAAAGLGADQVEAVAGIVSSGRAADVLIGPAGTGKSYTVATLAGVWERRFGGRVLGLATSQIAAQVLAEDGVAALNTTRFLQAFEPGPNGEPAREQVGPGDLFIVDEAGMSSTAELDRIARIVREGGGKLLYTGDSHQLTSVGAGGMLSLLADDNGAYELGEVHRFVNDWEKAASLRLRAGDTSVVAEYQDRGRLRGGTREEMQTAAVRGYLADVVEGKLSLLVVGSNADAATLSKEIRDQLIELGVVSAESVGQLGQRAGKVEVSVGDGVQARRNDPFIRIDGEGMVTNRAVYTVLGRDEDGSLRVRGERGEIAHLPPSYVDEHLTLAYASTVHAAQGRTVDTCHALLDEAAAREAAYVALTRGREANFAYLVAQRDPDQHDPERLAETASSRLAAVLGNVDAARAAEVERRIGERDANSLAYLGTVWDEVSKDVARTRYTDTLAGLLEPEDLRRVTAEAGWPRLVRAVREAELAGHDPAAVLATAIEGRPLADAEQMTDVLRWRVRMLARGRAPEQQVQAGDWTALAPPVDGPVGQFCHELAVLAQDRQHELGQAALADPPAWAIEQLGPPPGYDDLTSQVRDGGAVAAPAIDEVEAARQEWARRAGSVAAYRELRGIDGDVVSIGAPPSREQEFHRHLWAQAAAALGPQPDTGALDYRTMSDAELYTARERWVREQAFAPAYVSEEMQAAYQLGREYAEDAALAGARLATLEPDDQAWEQTAQQLERSRRLAQLSLERARQLEDIHQARQRWYDGAEPARVADAAARDELARRGLPPERDRGEQLPLFEPAIEETTPAAATGSREEQQRVAEPAAPEPMGERAQEPHVALDEPARRGAHDDAQLSLLDAAPRLEDEVGAAPLRQAGPELAAERPAWQAQADAIGATLAEARRAAGVSERHRAATAAPVEPDRATAALARVAARAKARREEIERREQLNRWAEQDRGVVGRGVDRGPGRGAGMGR